MRFCMEFDQLSLRPEALEKPSGGPHTETDFQMQSHLADMTIVTVI
jgi:hypothetical protein